MVTLCILVLIGIIGIGVAIGLIGLVGTLFAGVLTIILDILIGLAPFILIYWLWKAYKKWRKGDGQKKA